jgi:hypothetical protein
MTGTLPAVLVRKGTETTEDPGFEDSGLVLKPPNIPK